MQPTDTTNRIRPIDGHGLVGLAMAGAWLQTTWERCYVQARYVPPGEYAARGPANWNHGYWDACLGHCNAARCVTVESCPAREVAS
jgi:hypothetical protein